MRAVGLSEFAMVVNIEHARNSKIVFDLALVQGMFRANFISNR
jgi:hypothetical protein